jgi:hypothetical protein
MATENIHVNSFMYEPILDMSEEHLRKLYQDVAALDATVQGSRQSRRPIRASTGKKEKDGNMMLR